MFSTKIMCFREYHIQRTWVFSVGVYSDVTYYGRFWRLWHPTSHLTQKMSCQRSQFNVYTQCGAKKSRNAEASVILLRCTTSSLLGIFRGVDRAPIISSRFNRQPRISPLLCPTRLLQFTASFWLFSSLCQSWDYFEAYRWLVKNVIVGHLE